MKRRALGLGIPVLLLLVLAGGWWWTRMTPPVTEAEARAYLDRIVAAGRVRDFDKVCNLNGSVLNCRRILDAAMRNALPAGPPTVTGTRYYRKQQGGTAGRVLFVEGTTKCGKHYRTEVFVFRENRFHFKAVNAVYWSNYTFGTGPELTPPNTTPVSACP
jgi:hypothetical protein